MTHPHPEGESTPEKLSREETERFEATTRELHQLKEEVNHPEGAKDGWEARQAEIARMWLESTDGTTQAMVNRLLAHELRQTEERVRREEREDHKGLESSYMALKDDYSELARALGFNGAGFWGDPVEPHAEVLAKAKSLTPSISPESNA